jgi:hypothetical protein
MSRIPTLPGGCKSLTDLVRVIGPEGAACAPITLAAAKTFAAEQRAVLVHVATGRGMTVFRIVDEALKKRPRKKKS